MIIFTRLYALYRRAGFTRTSAAKRAWANSRY
jgi:hypothetical protein